MQIILERPRTKAERGRSRYWERLREVDALVQRDIALIRTLRHRTPIVDAGCGNGGFVLACREAGIDAIGVEAFAESVAVAAANGIDAVRGAGEAMPFASGAVDVVRLKEVLEHVQRPLDMAREMHRVLRPGGVFIAYVPTQWSQIYPFPVNFWDDYTHVRPFSRVGLQRLLEDAGFERMRIEGYTPPLRAWQRPIGAALSRTLPFLWRAVAIKEDGHA